MEWGKSLSSIWNPNSMASPVYRADEETQQNTALEGTDFQLVSQEAVHEVVARLNSTPARY
jgi:hypothetical protein